MTDTIHAKFCKAQAEFDAPKKDQTNPAFRSKYADLASVMDAIREPLAKHGLFLRQKVSQVEGAVCVSTEVMDGSGCSIDFGYVQVPVSKADAQGYGSALTYARRYGALSIGLAPEDDDGNAAVAPAPAKRNPGSAPEPAPEPAKEYTPAEARKKLYIAASSQNIGYEGKHITKWDSAVRQGWVAQLGEHFGMPFETAAQIDAIAAKFRKAINSIDTLKALPGYGQGGLNSED